MKPMKRLMVVLLAAMLLLTCACTETSVSDELEAVIEADEALAAEEAVEEAAEETPAAVEEPAAEEPAAEPFAGEDVNIAVLAGPTGIGASCLMEQNDAGETVNHYNFTVTSANDEVVAGLTSGEFDMAAIATNVAANLYNKTSGGVTVVAVNTLGVLYILENGDSVQGVADLAGRTIYCTGQGANPEYVLEYILTENGLTYSLDGSDADVQLVFLESAALTAGMASGEYDLCMLPVPAVTSVQVQNADVRTALDLTAEWNAVAPEGQLAMGCIAVRTEWLAGHQEAVDAFLTEYAASIAAVQADAAHAGELCEQYGIVAKAAIATKAIPSCNLTFISGADLEGTLNPYYGVLYAANPASIGGALPGSDLYYVG